MHYRTRSGSSPELRLELQSPRPPLAALACLARLALLARLFLLSPLLKDANPNPTATTGAHSMDAGAGINTRSAHSSLYARRLRGAAPDPARPALPYQSGRGRSGPGSARLLSRRLALRCAPATWEGKEEGKGGSVSLSPLPQFGG